MTSRSRKAGALKSTAVASPRSTGSVFGAIGNQVSRLFSGSTKESASESRAVVPSSTSRNGSKRSYGFATSNLSHVSDQNSEDLYRYKNISSDYMRETSPTRDDDQPAIRSDKNRSATRRTEHEDRPPMASGTRRPVPKRNDDGNQPDNSSSTGRFSTRRREDDYETVPASRTDRFATRRRDDDYPIANVSSTGRFAARRNDGDDQPVSPSSTDRFAARRNDGDDQPVSPTSTGRFAARRNDRDDTHPAMTSRVDRSEIERNADDADDDNDVITHEKL
jgi:hypothetical protein